MIFTRPFAPAAATVRERVGALLKARVSFPRLITGGGSGRRPGDGRVFDAWCACVLLAEGRRSYLSRAAFVHFDTAPATTSRISAGIRARIFVTFSENG